MILVRSIVATLVLGALFGCASVRYQRPGDPIAPRAGESLVFGRVRFVHDGREFFPWEATLFPSGVGTDPERHLWLLRLGRRAVSAELHPDADGSLAVWLASADYALVGSTRLPDTGAPPYEVVALLRVPPASVVAYAGDLILTTASHEGSRVSFGELGVSSVALLEPDVARATLESRFGALPDSLVSSPWCAGERLPSFDDPDLALRAKQLLDAGCRVAP